VLGGTLEMPSFARFEALDPDWARQSYYEQTQPVFWVSEGPADAGTALQAGMLIFNALLVLETPAEAIAALDAQFPWLRGVKSNLPSWGSIWAQARTVLILAATILGHAGFMYSTLVAPLLLNSAANARNGLPSTISWVAVPCFCK